MSFTASHNQNERPALYSVAFVTRLCAVIISVFIFQFFLINLNLHKVFAADLNVTGTTTISTNTTYDNVTINNGAILNVNGGVTLTVTNLLWIKTGGILYTLSSGTSPNGVGATIPAGSMTIEANGVINGDGKGYAGAVGGHSNGSGPGAGYYNGGGGSYGSLGASPNGGTYGSATAPVSLGSGGGGGGGDVDRGGAGGGAVKITITGTTTLNGRIQENGADGSGTNYSYFASGGSGGSIWLTTGILTGSGSFSAVGGKYSPGSLKAGQISGGGGRIAVYYGSETFTTDPTTTNTGAGTVVFSALGYNLTGVPSGLTVYKTSDWSTNVASTIQSGNTNIGIAKGGNKIASFDVNFTSNWGWSNVIADASSDKSVLAYSSGSFINIPGRNSATYTMYVPKGAEGIRVGFCPSATTLAATSMDCNGLVYIKNGVSGTVNGATVNVASGTGSYANYWVITGLTASTGAFNSNGYIMQSATLPENIKVVLASNPETDLSTTPVQNLQTVELKNTSTQYVIADIPLNFSTDLVLTSLKTGSANNKAFVHAGGAGGVITDLPGVPAASTYVLYVPKGDGTKVLICPGIDSLNAITTNCSNGYYLREGETSHGATASVVTIDSISYWKIAGLTGTGGMSIIEGLQDSMSRLAANTGSDHTFNFGTNYGFINSGESFTLKFDPVSQNFNLSSISISDIRLSDNADNVRTLADYNTTPTSGIWRVQINTTDDSITFFAPPSGTGYFAAASEIVIKIGTNAGGTNQIINPATPGSYRIVITLTNTAPGGGETGEVAIPVIDSDQVNVTGFVNTFISFDIDTGSTDTDCAYNTCLTHSGGSSAANYVVDLGELNSTWVNKSESTSVMHSDGNNGTINSIYFDLTTNAYNGAILYVKSTNGGLQGPGTNLIPSVTDDNNIQANDGTYGFQLTDTGSGNGTIVRNNNCTTVTTYCGLSTTQKEVLNTNGRPLDNGRIRMDLAAASSYVNNPGSYTDTLTFAVVATY